MLFKKSNGANGPRLERTTEVSGDRQNKSVGFTVIIPSNSSGRLFLPGKLKGDASAPSNGDVRRFNGSVQDTSFTVKRIGS